MHVREGDDVAFEITDEGTVVLLGLKSIPGEQAWFWTDEWQAGRTRGEPAGRRGRGDGLREQRGLSVLASLMPTYQRLPRFDADWDKLSDTQRARFRRAARHFIDDLTAGRPFRKGLRVKRIQITQDVFETSFAPDGRATWQFGTEVRPGEPHIVWRRIGTLDILRSR